MKKGLFITVEGPDGAGKTTQLEFMKKYLLDRGENVLFTREPGGTPISEKIRGIILDKKNSEMDPMTETLLYAASRAQHIAQVIGPALEHGKIVVCDRFVDSSIAYQGYGRKLGDCVAIINDYAIGGRVPDLTFLLKLDPSEGKSRIKDSLQDRIEREKMEFHSDVFNGYLELEKKYSDRIVGIDASRTIEEISYEIKKYLEALLGEKNEL